MRVREYDVMSRAVEEGVARGWRRAHKHTDDPDEDTIQNAIIEAVTLAMTEWFTFAGDESDGADESRYYITDEGRRYIKGGEGAR